MQVDAFAPETLSALLKSFFDHDADAFHEGAGFFCDTEKALHGLAVRKKIVKNEEMVMR